MAGLGEFIASLLGGGGPKVTVDLAPPMQKYPSSEDAAYARKYGFGGGDPRMDTSSNSARVLGRVDTRNGRGLPTFVPGSGQGSYLEELTGAVDGAGSAVLSQAPSSVADTIQRAALAANRIPVAALGFDPTRMVADTQIKNPTVGGAYTPSTDSIYYNIQEGRDPSTPVHESIHRGMAILRKDPANAQLFRNLPTGEESAVRELMRTEAGDPENGSGDAGQKQRDHAQNMYKARGSDSLKALNRAAADAIAKRRPGGPR